MPLYSLRARIAIDGARAGQRVLSGMQTSFRGLEASARLAGSGLSRFALAAGRLAAAGHGLAAVAAGIGTAAIALKAFETAADYDSLVRGLATVGGSAEETAAQIARLREVAKLPGLGFQEAVQASLRLQSVGLSARFSERAIMAFGNALASVGYGREELEGVILAMTQIASKGKVSAEEINQLQERLPQIRLAMTQAFGTADTEALSKMGIDAQTFIARIVAQFERLPKASGGVKNSLENLSDLTRLALLPLGQGLIVLLQSLEGLATRGLAGVERWMRQIGEVLAAVGRSGVLADVFEKIGAAFGNLFSSNAQQAMVNVLARILSFAANLPEVLKRAGSYISDLFSALWQNGVAAFARIEVAAMRTMMAILEYVETVRTKLLAFNPANWFNGVLKRQGQFVDQIGQVRWAYNMAAERYIHPFTPLPDPRRMMGLGTLLGQSASEYAARIQGALRPLSDLPDSLQYGRIPQMARTGGQRQQETLEKIQQNTRQMADNLLRRQALGGGEMGQVGVTPAELGGSGLFSLLSSAVEKEIDRRVALRLAAMTGGGFRPR